MRRFIAVPALALLLVFALERVEAQLDCKLCDAPISSWTEPQGNFIAERRAQCQTGGQIRPESHRERLVEAPVL